MADTLTAYHSATRARLVLSKLVRATGVDLEGDRLLREAGVDTAHVWNFAGPIYRQHCSFPGSGRAIYDEMGESAFLVELREADDETPSDILAWSIRRPARFGTLLGQAGLAGVHNVVNPASYVDGPCHVWETPLRWLQEGCQGTVVLDADLARPLLAKALGPLACESRALAEWLVEAKTVPGSSLLVPKTGRRAA